MISKRTFVGIIAAATTMTLIACEQSFKMTCDPANPAKSVCAEDKKKTMNTPLGPFDVSTVSATAYPYSPEAGYPGGIEMTIRISAQNLNPRQIAISGQVGPATAIQNQGNEPQMRYALRCADASCLTIDAGVYFAFTDNSVKVYAIRISGSTVQNTVFVPVDGVKIQMDNPTSALNTYPSI